MKELLRPLARFPQQSGRNCILDRLLKNCQEICLEKNPSSIVSQTLRWRVLDFCQKNSAGLSKLPFSCPEENCENCSRKKTLFLQIPKIEQTFFENFRQRFPAVCQNCCILGAQRKTTLKKFFFSKNSFFFDHFQQFIKNFRTFHQLLSSGLSNVPFQCPDELCLAN